VMFWSASHAFMSNPICFPSIDGHFISRKQIGVFPIAA